MADTENTSAAVVEEATAGLGPAAATISGAVPSVQESHPLETKWCLWLRLQESGKNQSSNWADSQICGHTFGTVEEFWRMFNNVRGPFEIGSCDYSIFREGIRPAWEDDFFQGGGRLAIALGNVLKNPQGNQQLNNVWLHLMLALIGENFNEMGGSAIGGLRVVVKRSNIKLEVWTKLRDRVTLEPLAHAVMAIVGGQLAEAERRGIRAQYTSFDDKDSWTLPLQQ